MSHTRRWILFSIMSLTFFLMVLATAIEFMIARYIDPGIKDLRARQAAALDAWQNDRTWAREWWKESELQLEARTKDAGPLLNRELSWENLSPTAPTSPTHSRLIDAKTHKKLIHLRERWLKKAERFYIDEVVIGLLDDLAPYDHWVIEKNSPLENIIFDRDKALVYRLPYPSNAELLSLARLRLIRGMLEGNPLPALKSVRHLAKLVFTTENFGLMITGLAILRLESEAHTEFLVQNQMKKDEWRSFSVEDLARLHRFLWGLSGYLKLWTEDKVFDQTVSTSRNDFGYCAVLNHELPQILHLRGYLLDEFPFERSFTSEYARMDELIKQSDSVCRLVPAKEILNRRPQRLTLDFSLAPHIPFYRRLVGMQLVMLKDAEFRAYQFPGPYLQTKEDVPPVAK